MGLGKTYSTQYLLDSNNNTGVAGQVLSTTSTGIDWADANTLPGAGLWLESGNDIYNSNSGNVGIGITTPYTKLVIGSRGTALAPSILAYDGIAFDFHNDGPPYARHAAIISQASDATEAVIDFWTKPLNGSNSKKMTLRGDGNLGIGTTNPGAKLEVNSDGFPQVRIHDEATGGEAGIRFKSFTAAANDLHGDIFVEHSSGNETGRMGFRVPFTNERLTILSTGNVGIGTTSPHGKLSFENTAETRKIVLYEGADNNFQFYGFGIESNTLVYTTAFNDDDHVFYSGASATTRKELMRIEGGGNVGIGTDSPGAKLSIDSVPQDALSINSSDGNGPYAVWRRQSGTLGFVGNANALSLSGNTNFGVRATNDLVFAAGGASEKMRITSAGNVGIGTTSPAQILHTNTSSNVTFLGESSSGSNTSYMYLKNAASTSTYTVGYGSTGDAAIITSGGSERMRITSAGNVGIGTTSPTYKLDVVSTGDGLLSLTGATKPAMIFKVGTAVVGGIQAQANTSLNVSAYGTSSLNLQTAGTAPRLTILTGGNVGIGTTSPSKPLDVRTDVGVLIKGASGSSNAKISFVPASGGRQYDLGNVGADFRIFDASAGVTRMYFDNDGNTGIGTTSPGSLLEIEGATNSSTSNLLRLSRASQGSTPEKVAGFYSGTSGEKGYITVNNFGTAYNTSSDYRLKENIKPIEDSVERLMSLKPCNFNFISEEEDKIVMDGFIAHEAKEVVPEAVTGIKDAVDEKGNPMYQGIDQSKIVPLLTAALQQALQRIEILEQKINN